MRPFRDSKQGSQIRALIQGKMDDEDSSEFSAPSDIEMVVAEEEPKAAPAPAPKRRSVTKSFKVRDASPHLPALTNVRQSKDKGKQVDRSVKVKVEDEEDGAGAGSAQGGYARVRILTVTVDDRALTPSTE